MALDGSYRSSEDGGESLHAGPAEAGGVVSMVAQSLVGRQNLNGAAGVYEVRGFGDSGKLSHELLSGSVFGLSRVGLPTL